MRAGLTICFLSLFAVTAVAPLQAEDQELKKWQGAWTMVSLERKDKKYAKDKLPVEKIVVSGKEMKTHIKKDGTVVTSQIKLDPTRDPRELDVTIEGVVYRAIYRFDGNSLFICTGEGDAARPKRFSAQATTGSGGLAVYQRIK